ncbi:RNA polymerase sigma factor [Kitasatospora sp. NPDC004289]
MSAARSDGTLHDEVGGGEDTSPASSPCFEAFAQSAWPALVRAARRYVPDHTADDIAQTALESIFKQWGRVARMDHPVGYAVTVARSRAIDHLRRQREVPVSSEELTPLVDEGLLRAAPSGDVDLLELVLSVAEQVPGRTGQVLHLSLFGYAPQEIAGLLGVAPSTVRVLLHRARQYLMASEEVRSLIRSNHRS